MGREVKVLADSITLMPIYCHIRDDDALLADLEHVAHGHRRHCLTVFLCYLWLLDFLSRGPIAGTGVTAVPVAALALAVGFGRAPLAAEGIAAGIHHEGGVDGSAGLRLSALALALPGFFCFSTALTPRNYFLQKVAPCPSMLYSFGMARLCHTTHSLHHVFIQEVWSWHWIQAWWIPVVLWLTHTQGYL